MPSVPKVTTTGNVERFERLFTEHIEAVLRYALARVDPETAKDAVADTFLVAWRRLDEVPDVARSWLLGVTRRTLSDQRRSHRRQHTLAQRLASTALGSESSPEAIDGIADRFVVMGALRGLRKADREVLCLVAWDGLGHREAAEVLGCSAKAFAVRLHRARRRLEEALDARDGTSADENHKDDRDGARNQIKR
jgi:RNA polymerase sigma-70 factor, ECF subfamily